MTSSRRPARFAIASDTAGLDLVRRLALSAAPRATLPALATLWRLDVTFGQVIASGRDPLVTRIRLAWWREALERLDRDRAPAEPLLKDIEAHLLPSLAGAELAAMENGWAALTEAAPLGRDDLRDFAEQRGGRLFELSARLLGGEAPGLSRAGAAWALVDLVRRATHPDERSAATALAHDLWTDAPWPRRLRPLAMLRLAAAQDLRDFPALSDPARLSRLWPLALTRFTGR